MKEVSVLETVSVGRVFLIRVFDNTGLLLVGRQTQVLWKNRDWLNLLKSALSPHQAGNGQIKVLWSTRYIRSTACTFLNGLCAFVTLNIPSQKKKKTSIKAKVITNFCKNERFALFLLPGWEVPMLLLKMYALLALLPSLTTFCHNHWH